MPTYRYRCPENGEILEVRHSMRERVETWGELCLRLLRDAGQTRPDAPVERIIDGGMILTSRAVGEDCCTDPGCMHRR